MDVRAFVRVRPFAYHTTARANLSRIAESGGLVSASTLLGPGVDRVRERRSRNVSAPVGDEFVVIRDQLPLAAGNIDFDEGWDLGRLVEHLNSFVYFWPGTARGPRANGIRHLARYAAAGEDLAVLRVSTDELLAVNSAPRFSACNSGSPRMSGGRRCRRGACTFVEAGAFSETPSRVVEVVFANAVRLPPSTQWSSGLNAPWSSLVHIAI